MWKLALCQTDVVFKYPDANYARIEKAIVEAAKKWGRYRSFTRNVEYRLCFK